MMSDREIEEYKRNIADLETSYSLLKKVFENLNHYTAKECTHKAMLPVHSALNMLKQRLTDET